MNESTDDFLDEEIERVEMDPDTTTCDERLAKVWELMVKAYAKRGYDINQPIDLSVERVIRGKKGREV